MDELVSFMSITQLEISITMLRDHFQYTNVLHVKLKVVHGAPGGLEGAGAPGHRKLQPAGDTWPVVTELIDPPLEPQLRPHIHVDVVVALALLPRVRCRRRVPQQDLCALEHRGEIRRAFVAQVEGRENDEVEKAAIVARQRLHVVEVDADPLGGVADAHGEAEPVLQVAAVATVVELGEGGLVDVDIDAGRNEGEHEDGHEDDEGEDEDGEAKDSREAAAEAAGATAGAAVSVARGHRRAIVDFGQI